MGRIFEVRKSTMFARWDRMAKQFTRVGKEIVIAVKAGGPDPATNPALRRAMQNGKAVNMPKDRVEAAIKRAQGKDTSNYEEILYEGYAPHGGDGTQYPVTSCPRPERSAGDAAILRIQCIVFTLPASEAICSAAGKLVGVRGFEPPASTSRT